MRSIVRAQVLAVGLLLSACATVPNDKGVTCRTSEMFGCLEINVNNLAVPDSMQSLPGSAHFAAYKRGELEPASQQDFIIFIFGAKPGAETRMAEYQLPKDYRTLPGWAKKALNALPVRRTVATPPTFDSVNDPGRPDYILRITAPYAGAALQIPWDIVGEGTYILICRANSKSGIGVMITPAELERRRRQGDSYIMAKHVAN